jgi:YgiT-type zinc finger domain-containing protein
MSQHCAFCGHKHLTAKATRYIHQQADEPLIVDDVPCLECGDYGEQYFDAAILKAIEAEHTAIVQHRKMPQAAKPVAVESFATLAG